MKKELRTFGRNELKEIINIRTRHIELRKYLNGIGKIIPTKCSCGKEDETPLHLWNECKLKGIKEVKDEIKKEIKEIIENEIKRLERQNRGREENEKWWRLTEKKIREDDIKSVIFMDYRFRDRIKKTIYRKITTFFKVFISINKDILQGKDILILW